MVFTTYNGSSSENLNYLFIFAPLLALIVLTIFVIYFIIKRRKHNHLDENSESMQSEDHLSRDILMQPKKPINNTVEKESDSPLSYFNLTFKSFFLGFIYFCLFCYLLYLMFL